MKILSDAMMLAGAEMEIIERGYIAIEGGKIAEVESGSSPHGGCGSIDMGGCLIVPGLINAHTHVGDSIAKEAGVGRGLHELMQPPSGLKHRILRETPPERLISAMRDTLQDMLRGGTTTFADFREGGLEGVRLLRAAVEGLGIRTLALGRPSFQFQEGALEANEGEFPPEGLEEIRRLVGFTEGLGLSSPNEFTDNALQQLSELFKGKKLTATHTAEDQISVDTSVRRTGFSDVERALRHLRADFLVHLTRARGEEIRRVAEVGVPVVCCPRANAALGLELPPIRKLMELGVTVALGTDNVMVNSADIFREMDFTSRFLRVESEDSKTPTPLEIFSMVTINAARLLGLGDRLGAIEPGKLADLVVIDARATNLRPIRDPLSTVVNRVRPDNVKTVLVGGNVVYNRS